MLDDAVKEQPYALSCDHDVHVVEAEGDIVSQNAGPAAGYQVLMLNDAAIVLVPSRAANLERTIARGDGILSAAINELDISHLNALAVDLHFEVLVEMACDVEAVAVDICVEVLVPEAHHHMRVAAGLRVEAVDPV